MTTEVKKNAKRVAYLSAKTIGFPKVDIQEMTLKNKKAVHKLFHVVGTVTGSTVKEGKTDEAKDSVEFKGAFEAINIVTGERYRSGKLYLPSIIEGEIAAALAVSSFIKLAVTVTALFSEKSATSYNYDVEMHGEEIDQGFDAMFAEIPGMAALAKPETKKLTGKK